MIFQYKQLKKHPSVFRAVTGLSVKEFDSYSEPLIIELAQAERSRLERKARKRAVGGGRNHDLKWREQLLMTLVWLRLYPTCEVLGYFFNVSDSTANRVVRRCLLILEQEGWRQIEKSKAHAQRKRGYRLEEIFEQVPGLAVVIDAFEQAIEQPSERSEADDWYSGKKKTHTIMSQVGVDAYTGEVLDVAKSERGGRQDKGYFNDSDTPDRLPEDTAFLGDLGYPGLDKDLPLAAIPRKKPRGKPRPEADKVYNKMFSQKRVIVENTIALIRRYLALLVRDRHHRQLHTQRVVAVAGLVNFTKRCRFVF
jgi:hypothetical protein